MLFWSAIDKAWGKGTTGKMIAFTVGVSFAIDAALGIVDIFKNDATTWMDRLKNMANFTVAGATIGYGLGGPAGAGIGALIGFGLGFTLNLFDYAWEHDWDDYISAFVTSVGKYFKNLVETLAVPLGLTLGFGPAGLAIGLGYEIFFNQSGDQAVLGDDGMMHFEEKKGFFDKLKESLNFKKFWEQEKMEKGLVSGLVDTSEDGYKDLKTSTDGFINDTLEPLGESLGNVTEAVSGEGGLTDALIEQGDIVDSDTGLKQSFSNLTTNIDNATNAVDKLIKKIAKIPEKVKSEITIDVDIND